MGHLSSLIGNTQPPEPPLPPALGLNGSPKSALLVEDDESLSKLFRMRLKDRGYCVRTASCSKEGLRLYRDFGPFNVVLINYCVPEHEGQKIDPLVPQTKGIELALAIRDIDSAQGIIIAAVAFRSAVEVPRPLEAMNLPILLDSCGLRDTLEKIEVDVAIKNLTTADRLRLRRIANSHIRILGRAAQGKDSEDLLNDALCRTLVGAEDMQSGRHWNRKVPFVQHLAGTIRSIANLWRRQYREQGTYSVSELTIYDAEGNGYSPLDNVPSPLAPADQHLSEQEEEDRILAMFNSDPEATQVLKGTMDGLTKSEIMARSGLEAKKYAATLKRIRLKLLPEQ